MPKRWSIRAWGLFVGSLGCVTRGILYLPPSANSHEPLPLGVDAIADTVPSSFGTWSWQPIWLFGAAWLAVGIAGIVAVIRGRRGRILFPLMVGLMACWALGFSLASVFLDSRSGWAQGAFYAVLAAYTALFARIKPAVSVTPSTVEARLRVDRGTDADQFFWLQDGRWVEIYPDVTR